MRKIKDIKVNEIELQKILDDHNLWLSDKGGKRANLQHADLRDANLQHADLRDADLRYANLRDADLRYANLQRANLQHADLRYANLRDADLRYANLRGADLDYSCLPLWCGGINFKIDEKQVKQLMYHVINLMQYSELDITQVVKKKMYKWLEDSHIVTEHKLPILKEE